MGTRVDTQKVILWDNDQCRVVTKTEVIVRMVTNKGTVMVEEGPLYCVDGKEVYEATRLLYDRLIASLPGISRNDRHEFREDIVAGGM